MSVGPGFDTLAVHAGAAVPAVHTGGSAPPSDCVDAWIRSLANAPSTLEERLAALEGGTAAVAVASGDAARLLVFHTLLSPGDEIVASRNLRESSKNQFMHTFPSFGWRVKWADPSDTVSWQGEINDRTKAIFVESIVAPGGILLEIERVADIAQRCRLPLIVDNTAATPYLCRPIEHGADVVVHSLNGSIGGPGNSIGGAVVDCGTFDWSSDDRYPSLSESRVEYDGASLHETFGNVALASACRLQGLSGFGSAIDSARAFAILQGIETLSLRMQRRCDSALAVARHLQGHATVASVVYAGLPDDSGHSDMLKYAPNGAGPVLTFELAGNGDDPGSAFVGRLSLFSRSADERGARSIVRYPVRTASHRTNQTAPTAVCLSIGLESVGDIIADLDQALATS